jgi:hypothetical protein
VTIHQDADLYAAALEGEQILFPLRPGRDAEILLFDLS